LTLFPFLDDILCNCEYLFFFFFSVELSLLIPLQNFQRFMSPLLQEQPYRASSHGMIMPRVRRFPLFSPPLGFSDQICTPPSPRSLASSPVSPPPPLFSARQTPSRCPSPFKRLTFDRPSLVFAVCSLEIESSSIPVFWFSSLQRTELMFFRKQVSRLSFFNPFRNSSTSTATLFFSLP